MSAGNREQNLLIEHQTIDPQRPTDHIRLSEILSGIAALEPTDDRLIGRLQLDSRQVECGDVFVALPGTLADGRDYILDALHHQASAVLYESQGYQVDKGKSGKEYEGKAPMIGIDGLTHKLSRIASVYFRNPSSALKMVGVTGTNGKTTTTYLTAQALEQLGLSCGYSGTLGSGKIGSLRMSDLTTLDVISMHRQLADFCAMQMAAASLEVSSHGLTQGRVNGIEFDIAVLTNLSRDHLDYHYSMEEYGRAKRKLFDFPSIKAAVVNSDDAFGQNLILYLKRHRSDLRCLTYGLGDADLAPRNLEVSDCEIQFDLGYQGDSARIRVALTGQVNVLNVLATVGVLVAMGYRIGEIAQIMPELSAPPGRMELFTNRPRQPGVVVDYAHTPDALEKALHSLKSLCHGELVVVFGCGGDRDREKRPQMGAIAERLADRVIITDDNPRFESPKRIVEQILQGMRSQPTVIHDREMAVREAIQSCTSKDLILLAGKGHETRQITGHKARRLSDRELVRELLEQLS